MFPLYGGDVLIDALADSTQNLIRRGRTLKFTQKLEIRVTPFDLNTNPNSSAAGNNSSSAPSAPPASYTSSVRRGLAHAILRPEPRKAMIQHRQHYRSVTRDVGVPLFELGTRFEMYSCACDIMIGQLVDALPGRCSLWPP
jgi:hypothetical protein